ncbi:arylsulfatase B-like [Glandiceps talaboti]
MTAILSVTSAESSDSSSSSEAQHKPHIIYMMSDDHGWNDISWHDDRVLTPNFEELANNGVKFGNLYTMAVCSPTRSALMTGRYPSNIGGQHLIYFTLRPHGVPTYYELFPKRLQDVGYTTYGVGKWHLGFCNSSYVPSGPTRGFDHYYGFYNAAVKYYEHTFRETGIHLFLADVPCNICYSFSEGTGPHQYLAYDLVDDGVPQNGPEISCVYNSELFQKKALSYIESHDPDTPMFLYFPFQLPHTPREVPKEWEDMYSCVPNDNRRISCAQVTFMDAIAGSIVEALKVKGMFNDSLFIFHADNGGDIRSQASNWPYRGNKGNYFEGGIKSVGFISGKGIEKTGYTHDGLFHVTDMYPTLINGLLGQDVPDDLDGINVWDAFSKGEPSPRTEMLITLDTDLAGVEGFYGSNVTAYRKGDWKLIIGHPSVTYSWASHGWYPPQYTDCDLQDIPSPDDADVNVRLYNLKDDPYEYTNVADQHPDVVADIREALETYEETAWTFWPEEDTAADPTNFGNFWSQGWC